MTRNTHSVLRSEIESVRLNPAVPELAPWSEFIDFAESLDTDIGPMFGRDAARVGRYVRSLEEQLRATEKERDEWQQAYGREVGLDVYNRQSAKRAAQAPNPASGSES